MYVQIYGFSSSTTLFALFILHIIYFVSGITAKTGPSGIGEESTE